MNSNKISIIVPVYNVENYIGKCLDSIINQTLKDIEIICVNDGSTDNSANILQEYANNDNRIRIISQKNQGVSAARNTGLLMAEGEYVMFFDGDDYYSDNTAFEKVLDNITKSKADISIFGFSELIDNKITPSRFYLMFQEAAPEVGDNNYFSYPIYVHNKIFRKNFLQDNNIKFNTNVKNAEDFIFSLDCYFHNPKYSLLPEVLYVYRKNRKGSATNSANNPVINDATAFVELYKNTLFTKQPLSFQLKIVNRFLNVSLWYAKRFNAPYRLMNDTKFLTNFVESMYSKEVLNKLGGYTELKKYQKKFLSYKLIVLLKQIFSIKNSNNKTNKIITILGIKIKLKRKVKKQSVEVPKSQIFIQSILKKFENGEVKYNIPELPNSNGKAIVFSCDNNYCKYFAVALKSLIDNSNADRFYDIILFIDDITDKNIRLLKNMLPNNFSLRFVNLKAITNTEEDTTKIETRKYWNINCFYRLFIPLLLNQYQRVIYLDSDLIAAKPIDELFDIPFENNLILGAKDDIAPIIKLNPYHKERLIQMSDSLSLKVPDNYINSGVLVYNNYELNNKKYIIEVIKALSIPNLLFPDQDIINKVFQDKIKFLPLRFNFEWHIPNLCPKDIHLFTGNYKKEYEEAVINPTIIHFTSGCKPWNTPDFNYADYFWKYARLTPYYEEILQANCSKSQNRFNESIIKNLYLKRQIYLKYYKYKFLSEIARGKKKIYYKNKKWQFKDKIKEIKEYSIL